MKHLIVSREYPPCSYPQGGIGTYVAHVARLLAERGETVHVIGEQWVGAPLDHEVQCDGRLIIHRVPLGRPLSVVPRAEWEHERALLEGMAASDFPAQAFSWQAARLAESLIRDGVVDCIEAQDYESPLYYFLLRRALGYGPTRTPPCFVHLHSPMQFICHHNDWAIGRTRCLTMKRLEDYVIKASDAALCPSHYLAGQVERHYGLPRQSVVRIPYPKGDTPYLERTADTWKSGSVCYVGRMEGRKGVFEWVDAAVLVARERPGLTFEFIGADTSLTEAGGTSVRDALIARIPDEVKASFRFLDAMPRPELFERLRLARVAVVPSRWENFPNTCVEAMSTGLPALVSPEGGMAEMVEDGRTGWIAASVRPTALADALRRALETSAEEKNAMGRAAAEAIRALCDNRRTIDEQIAFRSALIAHGPSRSLAVPLKGSSVVWTDARGLPDDDVVTSHARSDRTAQERDGVVVVMTAVPGDPVDSCLESLLSQTQRPAGLVFSAVGTDPVLRRSVEDRCRRAGVDVLGLGDVFRQANPPVGIAFVAAGCRVEPEFLASTARVLAGDSTIGVVSSWHRDTARQRLTIRPRPERPYQWVQNDSSPCVVFRTTALVRLDWLFTSPGGVPGAGEIVLAALLDGWASVTLPDVLGSRDTTQSPVEIGLAAAARTYLMPAFRERFSRELADDTVQLVELTGPYDAPSPAPVQQVQPDQPEDRSPTIGAILRLPLRNQWQLARQAMRDPQAAVVWAVGQARRIGSRR